MIKSLDFAVKQVVAFWIMLISLLLTTQVSNSQSTCSNPTQISGFGVDGDVQANTPASVLGDSWFSSPSFPGTGVGVIGSDSSTAIPAISAAQFNAIIQSGATSQDRNRTYLQRMAYPFLSVVNSNTLIDAFSGRDNISPDTTAFAGSNKNGDNPSNWNIAVSSVPNKNDIIDIGGHLRRSGVDNKLWMFAYVTKLATTGDSYTDIEIYRSVPVFNPATGNFSNTGPTATGGHSSFSFSSSGAISVPGDILVCLNYNATSGVASIRIWCNINNLDGNGNGIAWFNALPGRPFNFTGDFITGAGSNGYGYAEISSLSGASCLVYSVLNGNPTQAGYWGNLSGSSASYSSNLDAGQLVNIAMNFTDFGLDFATVTGPCSNVFGALLFKTRSSSSFSSELKDVSGPFEFANFSEVQANAGPDMVLNCNTTSINLAGSTPTQGVTVTWSALSGNIVSGANSFAPVVNQPGVYVMYVQSPTISTCVATDTVVVTLDNLLPIAIAGTDKSITCSTPSVVLEGSSNIASAVYSWTGLSGSNLVSGATTSSPLAGAGCYVLTITNPENGCSSADTVCVISNTETPTINATSILNAACFSYCDGSITATASGAFGPYTYAWSTGATSSSINGLCAGNYTVTATGTNGCSTTSVLSVQQPLLPLTVASFSIQNASCNGALDGSATVVGAGGTAPYSYLWSNGSTGASSGNVLAGTYTVTITDANGCNVVSAALNVSQPNSLSAFANAVTNASCFGGTDGSIDLSVSGGTAPYTYSWSNGITNEDLQLVPSGSYSVTVTDNNGCSFLYNASIGQPAAPLSAASIFTLPVSCFSGSNGFANLNPSGGTAPYTYAWSNGQSSQSINGLIAGAYAVIVTDANGCTASGNAIVSEPSQLVATSTSIQAVQCNGGADGSINASITGGVGPYLYAWSNGASTEDLNGLQAGSYNLTVTDANGCTAVLTSIISEPVASLNVVLSGSQNASCFGFSDGSITVSVSGGTPGYVYLWSNGSTAASVSGLASGNYSVTVTDANGCISNDNYFIGQPAAPLTAQANTTLNVSCFGGANGSVSVNVAGGTTPYSFNWSNGSTNQNLTLVSSGNYVLSITDANGCIASLSTSISQPIAPLNASVGVLQNVSCNSGVDGQINAIVSGGTAPYAYVWSTGSTQSSISGLSAGSYSVTVTDANGCTSISNTTVSEPVAALNVQSAVVSNISCFSGNNGTIDLSVSGGTAPYTYLWNTGATSANISGLAAGSYTVTVTDANGCTQIASNTITQPAGSLSATLNISQNVACYGDGTGSLDLSVSGGTLPYTFLWSNGSSSEDIGNLPIGTYTVSVTDANGCIASATAFINQPLAPLASNISSVSNVNCQGGSDGSVAVSVSGGTLPYVYSWSNGASTANLVSLAAGSYTVQITDANGCTLVQSVQIAEPSQPLSVNYTSITQVSCFGGNNGSISTLVNGGTAPYTYTWSNGSNTSDLTGLTQGNYTLQVTDANGCTTSTVASIGQPAAPLSISTSSIVSVPCFGGNDGQIAITANNGTAPYSYAWTSGSIASAISGLSSGTYGVQVTDANGCTESVSFFVNQPSAPLTVNAVSISDVSCNGGSNGAINLSANGGTGPYSFLWNNGSTSEDLLNLASGTYSCVVTDANGCIDSVNQTISQPFAPLNSFATINQQVNCFGGSDASVDLSVSGGTAPYSYSWSNGSSNQDLSGLSAGIYGVLIIDANGCQDSASVIISQPQAALALASSSTVPVSCSGGNNGAIDLSVTGGTSPYFYQWSNGSSNEDLTGLSSGTYTVFVIDANGCSGSLSVFIGQPQANLAVSANSVSNVDCFGNTTGSIDLSVGGGTAPYAYQWNNGSVSEDLLSIPAGIYTVSVLDANGCDGSISITVNEPSNPLASTATVTQQVNCFAGNDGSIDLSVSGGTAPYIYSWSNGLNSEDLNGLSSGTYSVIITDANGCSDSTFLFVGQPQASLSLNAASTTDVDCFGNSTGSIDLAVTDGTAPYAYQWSNGSSNEDISGLSSGTYTVLVTDANGCSDSLSLVIGQPQAALAVSANSVSNVDCFGNSTGSIDLSVGGGTAPYNYLWSDGSVTEDLQFISAGTYVVSVVDANGCDATLSVTVNEPANPLASSATVTQQVNCFAGNDGSIDLTVTGGTAPYGFSWSNGSVDEDLNGLSAGTYSVIIIDSNGCSDSAIVVIVQPQAALALSTVSTSDVDCFGNSNGSIDLSVSGGTVPYSYQWSNGSNSEDLNGIPSGIYTVLVLDANGCLDSLSANITQPADSLALAITSVSDVDCYGSSTGSIDLGVSGGTQPYSYSWSNGDVTQDLNGVGAGTYTVTVLDINGCQSTITIGVGEPINPISNTINVSQEVNCFNGSDGSIDLNVSGGTSPYSYAWSNGATTQNITNLSSGNYSVLIIDANGCVDSATAFVNQPQDSLSLAVGVIQQVNCFGGNDGSIDLNTTGGTNPYAFQWSNGSVTEDISNLVAGTYTVTITDANGCTNTLSVVINQPAEELVIQQTSVQDVLCFGGDDASIDLTITGGTLPYSFVWSNGASSEDLTGIGAGAYSVTVTDLNGCTIAQNFQITQPSAALSVSGATLVGDCINNIGGDINITPAGGTAPYSYLWNTGATSQNLNNQPSAAYSVTVTDANGCTTTTDFVLANSAYVYVQITDPEICVGDSALLKVNVNVPATYQWYYNNTPIQGAVNDEYQAYVQGFYKCEVNSVCGVVMSDSVDVTVRSLTGASISSNQILCPPESVELVATGGVNYEWSPAIYISDPNASNPVVNPRESTTYTVLVTDDFGCKMSMSVDITVVCDTMLIPTGFSPNDDGVNDGYEIEGIENYPGNILYIYNRWGNLIYKAKDYKNNWTGECNVSGIQFGQKLPSGTYYYILDLNDGQKPRNGYIILRR